MAEIILVTGGGRSGKSAFAQELAEQQSGMRLFLATCPRLDPEMEARIDRHVRDRQGRGWQTVEEPLELAHCLTGAQQYEVVLVDCLTLWVNNLMYAAGQEGRALDEDMVRQKIDLVLESARNRSGRVILVTNEVGLGIVPDNATARLYRDLVGRCNQSVARSADIVYLITCGIAQQLKG